MASAYPFSIFMHIQDDNQINKIKITYAQTYLREWANGETYFLLPLERYG
jgi:hypothetical protein